MLSRKLLSLTTLLLFAGLLISCNRKNTVCPPTSGAPKPRLLLSDLINMTPVPPDPSKPIYFEIGGKTREINKLVNYPLCNDNWSGTVYVNCDAQVADAEIDSEDNPLFFKGCELAIEPNTVVYVAAHNDSPFYKGCSCHTGSAPSK